MPLYLHSSLDGHELHRPEHDLAKLAHQLMGTGLCDIYHYVAQDVATALAAIFNAAAVCSSAPYLTARAFKRLASSRVFRMAPCLARRYAADGSCRRPPTQTVGERDSCPL